MKKRILVQLLGNYIDKLRYPLIRSGIITEDLLQSGNPLGFVSIKSNINLASFPQEVKEIDNKVTQLTLNKNLDAYLSHSETSFCSNLKNNGYGKTVRYKNTSTYIIICNTNLAYPLYAYGDSYYSDTFPKNKLSSFFEGKGIPNIIYDISFQSVKEYYDKYIDILLREYKKSHIILVKTSPADFYVEHEEIKQFDNKFLGINKLIRDADQYFIDRTGCTVISTFERYVPDRICKGALPTAIFGEFVYDELAKEIINAVNTLESAEYAADNSENKKVKRSIFSSFFEKKEKNIKNSERLTEYINHLLVCQKPLSSEDISFINDYLSHESIEINDILALTLFKDIGNDRPFGKSFAESLLNNLNCKSVQFARARYKDNSDYLNEYKYCRRDIADYENIKSVFIRVNSFHIIRIDPNTESVFTLLPYPVNTTADYRKIISDGFSCSFFEAEALCKDLRFYIERAKKGNGNKPVKLIYDDNNMFLQTIYIADYARLLSNEPFFIGDEDIDEKTRKEFTARTNLEFLFKPNTKIVKIRSGLADQLTHYYLSKCISTEYDNVYYDDLHARSVDANHLGYELDKVLKEDISSKCFSSLFSEMLLKNFEYRELDLPDILFEAGLFHLIGVANMDVYFKLYKKCTRVFFQDKKDNDYENLPSLIHGFGPNLTYYYCFIRPEPLMLHYSVKLNELVSFPEFEDETNKRIQREMATYTSVGIHIRRGDYTAFAGETDKKYYRETISKVIKENKNIKFFVFSDDINWCKKNALALGLLQAGLIPVEYISHNKGENSFRDMQLLSMCKIIIGQQGGFARTAYLTSKICDEFITPDQNVRALHRKLKERSQ